MKILIIQLQRLGDILLSGPAISALRSKYENAQIHFLVRERFHEAATLLTQSEYIHVLKTRDVLTPFVNDSSFEEQTSTALTELNKLLDELKDEQFDEIINLSCSPLSANICCWIDPEKIKTKGYSRHPDLSLSVDQFWTKYYYAQVGFERQNRIHIADLLAAIAGVEIQPTDWKFRSITEESKIDSDEKAQGKRIAIQLGASQDFKTLKQGQWVELIVALLEKDFVSEIVLLGSKEEAAAFESYLWGLHGNKIKNLVGKTTLFQLKSEIEKIDFLICGDSMLQHIASYLNIPTMTFAFHPIRYWETGPRALKSRVFPFMNNRDLPMSLVVKEVLQWIQGSNSPLQLPESQNSAVNFNFKTGIVDEFQWQMILGIYFGGPVPYLSHGEDRKQVEGLIALNNQCIEFLKLKTQSATQSYLQVNAQFETLFSQSKLLGPLYRWYEAERAAVGPSSLGELIQVYGEIHLALNNHLFSLITEGLDHENIHVQGEPTSL